MIDVKKLKEKKEGVFDDVCSICLDLIDNKEPVRQICTCKHFFHSKCFLEWIKVNETCPNCKEELNKNSMLKKELEVNKTKKKDKKKGGVARKEDQEV